jgi:N-acetylglucosamine kinase-like BadF-type ATPase
MRSERLSLGGRAAFNAGQAAGKVHMWYLGVDGGNSGTRAVLLDADARVLGRGESGHSNYQSVGLERATACIAEAMDCACREAGCSRDALVLGYFALAGDDVIDDHDILSGMLERLLPGGRTRLSNDVWAGLRAGSPSGSGVCVNCGSGCGAVGRSPAGHEIIIPDLGYVYGDSGGGGQIAEDAVRAVVRAWDGRGEPTSLTAGVLEATGQPDVGALYLAMYRGMVRPRRMTSLTRLVFHEAARDDAVAAGILHHIGDELGVAAVAIIKRLGLAQQSFPLVLTGGAFRTLQSLLARAAIHRVQQVAPNAQPTLPLVQPVAAAGLLALDAGGIAVKSGHYQRLREQGYAWHPEETYA